MRKIITSLILTTLAFPAFCQITLNQSNFPAPADTLNEFEVGSQVTVPATGANQTWNYSSISTSGATAYTYTYPSISNDPVFTAAQFYSTAYFKNLNSVAGYNVSYYFENTATGSYDIGLEAPEQHYGIGTLTGNNADSIIVLDSKSYYPNAPRTIMPFPATGSTAWSSVTRHVVNMLLTVTSASLTNAPLTHVFYTNRTDTIVGWGTLNVPTTGGTTGSMGVLQDREIQYNVDSFYLNGSPAPQQLLTSFGLGQGAKAGPYYYRDNFYRSGAWQFAYVVNYTDSTFATMNNAYLNANLPIATGINTISAEGASTAYPNPFNGNQFNINFEHTWPVSSIVIEDISGRVVTRATVSNNSGIVHVETGNTLADGLYVYSLLGTDGNIIAKGKITKISSR